MNLSGHSQGEGNTTRSCCVIDDNRHHGGNSRRAECAFLQTKWTNAKRRDVVPSVPSVRGRITWGVVTAGNVQPNWTRTNVRGWMKLTRLRGEFGGRRAAFTSAHCDGDDDARARARFVVSEKLKPYSEKEHFPKERTLFQSVSLSATGLLTWHMTLKRTNKKNQ